jgi:hypothetical protein
MCKKRDTHSCPQSRIYIDLEIESAGETHTEIETKRHREWERFVSHPVAATGG